MFKQILISLIVIGGFSSPLLAQDANGRSWITYCQSGYVAAVDQAKCNSILSTLNQVDAEVNKFGNRLTQSSNFESGELGAAIDEYNYYDLESEYYYDLYTDYFYYE